ARAEPVVTELHRSARAEPVVTELHTGQVARAGNVPGVQLGNNLGNNAAR
ncbi:MAG: hypothetical protein QOC83_381, partial [Pseudonocardiales bacterium]|nr:hypothetical protein [Pseudonocardiales bacterium]